MRDKIALVDRGKCSFLQKVRDAPSRFRWWFCPLQRGSSHVPFCSAQTKDAITSKSWISADNPSSTALSDGTC